MGAAIAALVLLLPTDVTTPAGLAPAPSGIRVHGHRGARARFPENTLPAFRHALQSGVDALELDVVVTQDAQLAVLHDPVLDPARCQHLDGRPAPAGFVVHQHTLADLRAFDCGAKPHPRFPRQRLVPGTTIPTLEEVLDLAQAWEQSHGRAVELNIETKLVPGTPGWAPPPERFAELLVRTLERRGVVARSILQSFDHRVLIHAKALAPGLRTSALVAECRPDLVAVARAAGADAVSPHYLWITADDVAALHRARVLVIPWTVNEAAQWDRLAAMGVDAIISDDPAALLAHLQQRGLRGASISGGQSSRAGSQQGAKARD